MHTEMNGCIFTYFHQLRKPRFLSGNVRDGMTIFWQASGKVDIRGWIDTETATVLTFHSCDTFDFTILCIRSFDVGKRLKLETKVKSSSGGSCKSKFVGEQVILQTTSTYSCKCLVHWKGVIIYDNFMSAGLFFESLDSAIDLQMPVGN